jgi:hypothetical protein
MIKLACIVLGFSAFLFVISVLLVQEKPLETMVLFTEVNVTDRVGFDVNGTALLFGNIPEHGSSSRKVRLDNGYSFPIYTKISVEGGIGEMLVYEKLVKFEKGESKAIGFSVYGNNVSQGVYSGNVTFMLYKL